MSEELDSHFFQTPNSIIELGLKPNELLVLLFFLRERNREKTAYYGRAYIAKKCGLCLSSIEKVLPILAKRGFISILSGKVKGATNRYAVNVKIIMAQCVSEETPKAKEPSKPKSSTFEPAPESKAWYAKYGKPEVYKDLDRSIFKDAPKPTTGTDSEAEDLLFGNRPTISEENQ